MRKTFKTDTVKQNVCGRNTGEKSEAVGTDLLYRTLDLIAVFYIQSRSVSYY